MENAKGFEDGKRERRKSIRKGGVVEDGRRGVSGCLVWKREKKKINFGGRVWILVSFARSRSCSPIKHQHRCLGGSCNLQMEEACENVSISYPRQNRRSIGSRVLALIQGRKSLRKQYVEVLTTRGMDGVIHR